MHASCAKCTAFKQIAVNGHSLDIADKANAWLIYLVCVIVDGGWSSRVLASI
jgi:hypothetical protein